MSNQDELQRGELVYFDGKVYSVEAEHEYKIKGQRAYKINNGEESQIDIMRRMMSICDSSPLLILYAR